MVRTYAPIVLTLCIALVFIQPPFFKFTNSPETQYIFGTLDAWAGGFGFSGLFAPHGIFSQYVIGSAELIASTLQLAALPPALYWLRPIGALMAFAVISGAILFHLLTPLGVSLLNADGTHDGGLLFGLACGVWVSAATSLAAKPPKSRAETRKYPRFCATHSEGTQRYRNRRNGWCATQSAANRSRADSAAIQGKYSGKWASGAWNLASRPM